MRVTDATCQVLTPTADDGGGLMGVDVKKRKRWIGSLAGTAMLTIALIGTAAGLGQKALSQETPTEDIHRLAQPEAENRSGDSGFSSP